MKRRIILTSVLILVSFWLVHVVHASDGSFADQFLGNPLLVLVALIVLVGIAFLYHRIRK